jgi:hypothetical protein
MQLNSTIFVERKGDLQLPRIYQLCVKKNSLVPQRDVAVHQLTSFAQTTCWIRIYQIIINAILAAQAEPERAFLKPLKRSTQLIKMCITLEREDGIELVK